MASQHRNRASRPARPRKCGPPRPRRRMPGNQTEHRHRGVPRLVRRPDRPSLNAPSRAGPLSPLTPPTPPRPPPPSVSRAAPADTRFPVPPAAPTAEDPAVAVSPPSHAPWPDLRPLRCPRLKPRQQVPHRPVIRDHHRHHHSEGIDPLEAVPAVGDGIEPLRDPRQVPVTDKAGQITGDRDHGGREIIRGFSWIAGPIMPPSPRRRSPRTGQAVSASAAGS